MGTTHPAGWGHPQIGKIVILHLSVFNQIYEQKFHDTGRDIVIMAHHINAQFQLTRIIKRGTLKRGRYPLFWPLKLFLEKITLP